MVLQVRTRVGAGRENEGQGAAGVLGHGGPLRVVYRTPKGACVVCHHDPPLGPEEALPEGVVALPQPAQPDDDRAVHPVQVIEADGQKEAEGAQVHRVHQRVDPGESLPAEHPPQERLRGGPRLRGVFAHAPEEFPGRSESLDLRRRKTPVLGPQRLREPLGLFLHVGRTGPHEEVLRVHDTQGYDARELGADPDLHGIRVRHGIR